MKNKNKKKSLKFVMPDAYIIIFSIIVLAAVATYFIPAGSYDRETVGGITKVIAGSFTFKDSNPANVLDIFKSIQLGLIATANIIFLIFIIGGVIAVIESTGAIDAAINKLISKTKGRYILLITAVSAMFGVLASMGVVANAVIAFIPIGIGLARSLKLDAITGVAIIYLGYYSGMIAGVFDPTILGLAQTIAELPLFSGIVLRIFVFIALITVTILYTNRYAKKIKNNPEKSIMAGNPFGVSRGELRTTDESEIEIKGNLTTTQILVILAFIGSLLFFVYGAFTKQWGVDELAGIFIMMGVIVAIIAKITPNQFVNTFIAGAQSIAYGALVAGLARGVVIVMENGLILDTIVNLVIVPLEAASLIGGALLLFVFNMLFNLLVTAGDAQASIVMPIMVPVVDILGMTRQTGVLTFKLGDGFTNIIAPTSGVLMAVLAIGGVKWTQWIRFAIPLLLMWVVVGVIAIIYAVMTGYGPF